MVTFKPIGTNKICEHSQTLSASLILIFSTSSIILEPIKTTLINKANQVFTAVLMLKLFHYHGAFNTKTLIYHLTYQAAVTRVVIT